ncbi:MAG: amidohydrolase family protein, partial [Planctomycetota bacterium]
MKTVRTLTILVLASTAAQGLVISGEVPQAPSEELQRPAVVAFVNVNAVPMDRERILPGQTVIVRGERISEMGPVDAIDVPESAHCIDGRDKYLMPGLVDMHAHVEDFQLTPYIANGVTTVRNMWGLDYHLKLREEIKQGNVIGPTLFTTGPIFAGKRRARHRQVAAETPEQAAQVVTEHYKAGYDFIKVNSTLSAEIYDAIAKAAAKHGMLVVGESLKEKEGGIEPVLAAGQHTLEHLSGYGDFLRVEGSANWNRIDETKIPYIVRATREAGTWNCPTLVVHQKPRGREAVEQQLKRAYCKYVPPVRKQRLFETRQLLEPDPNRSVKESNRMRITKALHDAGVRILLGTDHSVMPVSVHWELRNLVDAGLTPYEAIKAGTRDAAECLGELDEFGTISAGLRADLILLEANPLLDVGNAARRIGVMVRGRWLPQS